MIVLELIVYKNGWKLPVIFWFKFASGGCRYASIDINFAVLLREKLPHV